MQNLTTHTQNLKQPKKNNPLVFAFDIGDASIGYSVNIANTLNPLQSNILLNGSNISVGAQNADINKKRRTARLLRKRLKRSAIRKILVKNLISNQLSWFTQQQLGLHNNALSKDKIDIEAYKNTIFYQLTQANKDNNCYLLRVKGLTQKLSKVELACVLLHIAKYRGYIHNTQNPTDNETEGKVIAKAYQQLAQNYSNYVCDVEKIVKKVEYETQQTGSVKNISYHNKQAKKTTDNTDNTNNTTKSSNYSNMIMHSNIIEHELPTLFKTQSIYYPELANIKNEYINIMQWQAEPKSFILKQCPLKNQYNVTTKHSISFLKFKLLSLLINLRYINAEHTEVKLTATQIINYYNLIINNSTQKITFAKLKKDIIKQNDIIFKGVEAGQESKKTFIDLSAYISIKNIITEITDEQIDTIYDIAAKDSNNINKIIANIQSSNLPINIKKDINNNIQKFKNLTFSGTVAYSYQAYNKIFNHIYNHINNNATTYNHNAKFDIQEQINILYPSTKPTTQHNSNINNLLPNIFSKHKQQPFKDFTPTNPVVVRVISEFRKLYNNLVNSFGNPDFIKIELLRELKSNKAQINQTKLRDDNELANFTAKQQYGNALKGRLYTEANQICLYCGTALDINTAEVDHILPYSATFNDSFNNKVIVHQHCNQQKGKSTPYLHFSKNPQQWEEFKTRVNHLNISRQKKNNLLNTNSLQDLTTGFSNRALNDSSYNSKLIKNYLQQYTNATVIVSNGQITNILRQLFELKKFRNIQDCCNNLYNEIFKEFNKNLTEDLHPVSIYLADIKQNIYNINAQIINIKNTTNNNKEISTLNNQKKSYITQLTNYKKYIGVKVLLMAKNQNLTDIVNLTNTEQEELLTELEDKKFTLHLSLQPIQSNILDYCKYLANKPEIQNIINNNIQNWVGNLHHAVDASLIALVNQGFVQQVATLFKQLTDKQAKTPHNTNHKKVINLIVHILKQQKDNNFIETYKQQLIKLINAQKYLQKVEHIESLNYVSNTCKTITTLKSVSKKVNHSFKKEIHAETIISTNSSKIQSNYIYMVRNGLAEPSSVARVDIFSLLPIAKSNAKKTNKNESSYYLRAIKLADLHLCVNRKTINSKNKDIILPEYHNLSKNHCWLLNGKSTNDIAIESKDNTLINKIFAYNSVNKLSSTDLLNYYTSNNIVNLAIALNYINPQHLSTINAHQNSINTNVTKFYKSLATNSAITPTAVDILNSYQAIFTNLNSLVLYNANFKLTLQAGDVFSCNSSAFKYTGNTPQYLEFRSYRIGDNQIDYRPLHYNNGQKYLTLTKLQNLKKHYISTLGFVSRGTKQYNLETNIFNLINPKVIKNFNNNINNIINNN